MGENSGRTSGRSTGIRFPSVTLSNGMRAVIESDRHDPGGFTLVVDGTPQSHVSLANPAYVAFEYIRRIAHAIDLIAPEGEPITALHLGGGAFTLPRYIAATRPGSRQQVVELESDLVDFVRENLPLPAGARIRVRHGDAREVLSKLPHGLKGTAEVVVVDVFSGARIPAHVTSVEFYTQLAGFLKPGGIVAVNVADGAGLAFARRQAATLSAVFRYVALVVDPQVLKSRRFGNVVMFAADEAFPFNRLPRLIASDPVPSKLIEGAELRAFISDAPVVTDQTATPSPPPARSIFQVKPGAD